MKTKESVKKREINTYKTVDNALDAKHEAARKFIQSIDKSKLKEFLTKNP